MPCFAISTYTGKTMGEQTLEFELLTCINMLNKKKKKKKNSRTFCAPIHTSID